MNNASPTRTWAQHSSIPSWLESEQVRLQSGIGSENEEEDESGETQSPESRKVPDPIPDAEVYEIMVDGTVEISSSITVTIKKVQ